MKLVGLDLGTVTLGIAVSDITNILASPYENFRFESENYSQALDKVLQVLEEVKSDTVILGLPKNMNNTIGPSAQRSLDFKDMLEEKGVKVILVDERLTTKSVESVLKSAKMNRFERKKQVDKLAAVLILQGYLDQIRR